MIPIINFISSEQKIENKSFLEKDLILHKLLYEISNNKFLYDNLAFKGGTCLTKCYLGYYRFSEDLDFTWTDQKDYANIDVLAISNNNKIKTIIKKFQETYSVKIHWIQTNKSAITKTLIQEIKNNHIIFNNHDYFMELLYK